MIKLLRIDDSLLHGQIAFSWVRNLKAHIIVIADDDVIKDEFTKMTLGLSKPPGVILKILSVDEAVLFLQDNIGSNMNIITIVNCVKNAEKIQKNLAIIKSINIGLLRTVKDVALKYNNTSFSLEDLEICKKLLKKGIEIELRLRYDDEKIYLKDLI